MARFAAAHGHADYPSLHRWSVDDPEAFWAAVWDDLGVIGERGSRVIDHGAELFETRFFPDARLNVAENLLAHRGPEPALVFHSEDDSIVRVLSRDDLRLMVGRLQAALERAGVGVGDRVAAWLPNIPETYAVMLAAAAIGATFSSTSPDFGVDGVVDRFSQVEPKVLFACDGYLYGGNGPRPSRPASRDHGGAAERGTGRGGALLRRRIDRRRPRRGEPRRVHPGARAAGTRVRPAPVRPPLVRPVLLGHDRQAEVHRPPGRRGAAEAPRRTPSALRREAR